MSRLLAKTERLSCLAKRRRQIRPPCLAGLANLALLMGGCERIAKAETLKQVLAFQEIVSWRVEAPLALGKETLAPT